VWVCGFGAASKRQSMGWVRPRRGDGPLARVIVILLAA
jgi:hypothetical protein